MLIVKGDNTTNASTVVTRSWALPPLAVFPLRSSNCVSQCTSRAWDYEAWNELPISTIPLWCTLIWEARHQLRDAPESEEIPKVAERQELQTLVGNKRNKLWIWTAVNSFASWIFGPCDRWAQCCPLQVIVEFCQMLAIFLLSCLDERRTGLQITLA